jgi:hypothetical protein
LSTPRFLADEDFRREIVEAARSICPTLDLMTVQDAALTSFQDAELLEFAAQAGRIMISHDVNTMIAAAINRIHPGSLCRDSSLCHRIVGHGRSQRVSNS